MNPLEHLATTVVVSKNSGRALALDTVFALLPDIANVALISADEWLPEGDARVRASRIMHSPLTVAAVLLLTRGRGWAYALHWYCDLLTHDWRMMLWPIRR